MTKGVSTEATGGIGATYERAVAAIYLAGMLASNGVAGLDGEIVRVSAQQPSALDDLEIWTRDATGATAIVRLQIKHQLALTASASNVNFAAIVADAWRDLLSPGFAEGFDRVGAAAERISADSHYAANRLNEIALLAADGEALFEIVDRPGESKVVKQLWEAVAKLSATPLNAKPSNDQLRFFWRHFIVLRIEATTDRDRDRRSAIDQLRAVTFLPSSPEARSLFGTLELIAGTLNVRGAGFDAAQLRAHLADRYAIELQAIDPALEPITRTARDASKRDADAWRDDLKVEALPPEFLPLDPPTEDSETGEFNAAAAFKIDKIEPYLRRHRRLAIQGAPGAGKTQSLVQIAQHLLSTSELVPIVRSLPRLALTGGPLLDGLATDPFNAIGRDGLALLARTGRLVLLLDGWNELGRSARDWAWEALSELKRLYPSTMVVVTTRSGAVRPFTTEARLELIEFDRDRQIAAAYLQHGPAGRSLLTRARSTANLRPLLRTPMFLTAILSQARDGKLPTDRESAIAQLVDVARGQARLRDATHEALDGQHFPLLEDLAWALMERGDTAIGEDDFRRLLASSLGRLRIEQRLFSGVTPPVAFDHLLADSILVASGEPGSRAIRFSHQLLQEWFASRPIDRIIGAAASGISEQLLRIIDAPFWETALLFSVERLSRENSHAAALSKLVSTTLGIEPFAAAEMLRRLPEPVKSSIDPVLEEFVGAWGQEQPTRNAAFMLASGRAQFSEGLWTFIRNHDASALGFARFHHGFPPDTLIAGWDANFSTLNSEQRRVLLIEIINQGDATGLDQVVAATLEDPESSVVAGVVDFLDFHDEISHLNNLLSRLDTRMGREIARERRPDGIDTHNRARWEAWRRQRLETADDTEWITLALELDAAPDVDIVRRLLALNNRDGWSARGLYERVAACHGAVLEAELTARLRRGEKIPFEAHPYVVATPLPSAELAEIIATGEINGHPLSAAARMLNGEAIGRILDELLAQARYPFLQRDRRLQNLAGALEHAQFDQLVGQVLARDASSAAHVIVLVDALADWHSSDYEDKRRLPLTPAARKALEDRVLAWMATIISAPESRCYELATLGGLIGRMGRDTLLPQLLHLMEDERLRLRRQHQKRQSEPGVCEQIDASYVYHYRCALIRIGGEEVIAAMVKHFPDPNWEVDAAVVLGRLRAVEPNASSLTGLQRKSLAERRASLGERARRPGDPIAAMILDRIDQLNALGDEQSIDVALQLAGPVTVMDYGDRGGSLRALLAPAREAHRGSEFYRTLAERGEMLPAVVIREQIDRESRKVADMSWRSDSDLWELKAWLQLVPYTDDPDVALPDDATLPSELRQHAYDELIAALGHSQARTALKAIERLRQANRKTPFSSSWMLALAEIGTEEAAMAMLASIEAAPVDWGPGRDSYGLTMALKKLLTNPAARARAFNMLANSMEPKKLGIIAAAIAETMDETDAVRLLDLADRPERAVIGRQLTARLDNAAVVRIPIPGTSDSFEIEGAPLRKLRKRALELIRTNAAAQHWARECLRAVDDLRDQYGKPWDEPNHPDVTSQVPWPEAAKGAWAPIVFHFG